MKKTRGPQNLEPPRNLRNHQYVKHKGVLEMGTTLGAHTIRDTVEPPLMDILYSGHLIIQDKMLWSGLNLHYA